MSLSLWIDGVDVTDFWYLPMQSTGEASFARLAGGQSPASFVLYDLDGASGYRPEDGQSVELFDGATSVLLGTIVDVDEEPMTELDTGVKTTIAVVDSMALPGRVTYSVTYPAGTAPEDILLDLVAGPLATFGITLDGAQAAFGMTVEQLDYVDVYVDTILNDLQTLTGWIWRVPSSLALIMVEPATVPVGFSLSDANALVMGTVKKKKQRATGYGNTVSLRCGPTGSALATARFTADGIATSWVTDIAAVDPPPALVQVDDGVNPPNLLTVGVGGAFEWDTPTHTLSAGTYGTPTAGTTLVLGPSFVAEDPFETNGYTAVFPFYVTRSDGPTVTADHGPWVVVDRRENITNYAAGVAFADALLRLALVTPWRVTVQHRAGLGWPGQTVPLSFSERDILGTYMILSVAVETDVDGEPLYTFECLSGDELVSTWVDYFKNLTSGGSGGGGTTGGVVSIGTSAVVSGPVKLGGSRMNAMQVGTTMTGVYDWMPFPCTANQTLNVRAYTRPVDPAVFVTPILTRWDGAAWVVHETGAPADGAAESMQLIPTALTAGELYRLDHVTDTAGGEAYTIGQLENP